MTYIIDMIKQLTKRRQFLIGETYYNFKLYMYYMKYHCKSLILLIKVVFRGVTAFLTADFLKESEWRRIN
jgi:hypothetical protein